MDDAVFQLNIHLVLNRWCCARCQQVPLSLTNWREWDACAQNWAEVRLIPTCWVGLLLLHAQKLRPLILGSDPLFPQEPTEQLVPVFTSCLISFVVNVSLACMCLVSELHFTQISLGCGDTDYKTHAFPQLHASIYLKIISPGSQVWYFAQHP